MSKNIKIQVMKCNLKSLYVMLKSKNGIVICTINELTIKLMRAVSFFSYSFWGTREKTDCSQSIKLWEMWYSNG